MYTAQASETAAALRERIEELEHVILSQQQTINAQANIIADLRTAVAERDVRLARLGRIGECHQ